MSISVLKGRKKNLEQAQRSQLRKGQSSSGELIKRKYSPGYQAFKERRSTYKLTGGTPDLYLRGDFHRAIFVKISGQTMTFGSKDGKTGKLVTKYGDTIFGLNPMTQSEIIEKYLARDMKKYMNTTYKIGQA